MITGAVDVGGTAKPTSKTKAARNSSSRRCGGFRRPETPRGNERCLAALAPRRLP
jgi:hypothetical protein